jgi:oligopeptide/dipeptide ABC transporter ATP-binding protein
MLALALVGRPELLIADEPTTMLDVITQAEILGLLSRTQRESGMALWLVTHDFGVVAKMANRVVVMYRGRSVEAAPANLLIERPRHPYTVGLRDSIASLDDRRRRLPQIPGEVAGGAGRPVGCSFANRCPRAMEICTREEPPAFALDDGASVKCWLYG